MAVAHWPCRLKRTAVLAFSPADNHIDPLACGWDARYCTCVKHHNNDLLSLHTAQKLPHCTHHLFLLLAESTFLIEGHVTDGTVQNDLVAALAFSMFHKCIDQPAKGSTYHTTGIVGNPAVIVMQQLQIATVL